MALLFKNILKSKNKSYNDENIFNHVLNNINLYIDTKNKSNIYKNKKLNMINKDDNYEHNLVIDDNPLENIFQINEIKNII